jgi:hypothetical protein
MRRERRDGTSAARACGADESRILALVTKIRRSGVPILVRIGVGIGVGIGAAATLLGSVAHARTPAGDPADRAGAAAEAPMDLAVATTRDVVVGRHGIRTRRTTFTLEGLPLRGAWETLRIDGPDARVVAARRPVSAPRVLPAQARVEPGTLPLHVADALDLDDIPAMAEPPQLVYLMVLGEPVLAWEVELPLQRWPEPTHMRVWMSATTGRLLREEELVFSSRARIFPDNPGKTPDPIEKKTRPPMM